MTTYECDYCDAPFDSPQALGGHVTTSHRFGDFECDECGETFEALAKYRAHRSGHSRRIGRGELQAELERLISDLERSPTKAEMSEAGRYSPTAYRNEFGTWSDALASLGHKPVQEGQISDQALIEAIQALASKLGRAPTATEMENQGAYSQRTCAKHFGSWANAVKEAGFEPRGRPRIASDELLAEISRVADDQARAPTVDEMRADGAYNISTYYDRFDSWREAVRLAGYVPAGSNIRSTEVKSIQSRAIAGEQWHRQRNRALRRDEYTCQSPGCGLTQNAHLERHGCGLHVHHITPRRLFVDSQGGFDAARANDLANLVSLCAEHHYYWEQFAPLRPDTR